MISRSLPTKMIPLIVRFLLSAYYQGVSNQVSLFFSI
jgi:hypothetical protein